MATGRMLRAKISVSPQVNDLSLKSALIFTWIIPHVDDYGRLNADPRRLKAIIVPMREDITIDDIKESLIDIYDQKLIVLYMVDDEIYLELTKFEKNQGGLHKRTASKIPPPETASLKGFDCFPGNSGKFREIPGNSPPIELNRTELNRIELNLTFPEGKVLSGKPDRAVQQNEKNKEYEFLAVEVLNFLNEKVGRFFRPFDKNLKPTPNLEFIIARLKSGVTPEQCYEVIEEKHQEWHANPDMKKYLCPSTLFNRTKFEKYLGEISK
jgi:uncharacterized phage protein (TIGR02220 family)